MNKWINLIIYFKSTSVYVLSKKWDTFDLTEKTRVLIFSFCFFYMVNNHSQCFFFDLLYYFFNGPLNVNIFQNFITKSRHYILYRFLFESVIPISCTISYVWCILWYGYEYKCRMHNTGCWKQNGIKIIKGIDLYWLLPCNTPKRVFWTKK